MELKELKDYEDAYFDFEVLPEFICVTFFRPSKNKWDTYSFDILDNNLDEKLYAFKNDIQNLALNNIFIGWNVFYDKTILYHILEYTKNSQITFNDDLDRQIFNHNFFNHIMNISQSIVKDAYNDYPKFDKEFIFYDASKYRLPVSLKVVAGEMGLNIEESTVAWNQKNLTNNQKQELIHYNINDVDVLYRINQKYYEAYQIRKDLTSEFSPNYLPAVEFKNNYFFNKIFDLKSKKTDKNEEQETLNIDDENFITNEAGFYNFYDSIKDNQKYLDAINYYYKDKENLSKPLKDLYDLFFVKKINLPLDPSKFTNPLDKVNKGKGISFKYLNMEVTFALGGVHGSQDGFITNKDAYMVDVASYYPNGMIKYHLQAKQVYEHNKDNILQEFLDKRLIYKHSDDPKLKAKDKPYKVLINAMYGATRAKFAAIYDPIAGTNLCVLGEFLLLALCEDIKDNIEDMIQINTDGIYYVPKKGQQSIIEQKVKRWEQITGFSMEYTKTKQTFNFNVNNYIIALDNSKYKLKGRFINQVGIDILKKSSMSITYDNYIIGQMIFDYFVNKKPFDESIKDNQELWKYASVKKITSNYDKLLEVKLSSEDISKYLPNGVKLTDKVNKTIDVISGKEITTKINRFFATTNGSSYKKYSNKKFITHQDFLDNVNKNADEYDIIKIDDNTYHFKAKDDVKKFIMYYNNGKIFTFKKYKNKDEYSFLYKEYVGEDFGYVSENSKIYNLPLFKDYDNNYNLNKDNILKVSDAPFNLDYEWYKNEAIKLIGSYAKGKIYETFVTAYPWLNIENFYTLNKIKKSSSAIDELYKD